MSVYIMRVQTIWNSERMLLWIRLLRKWQDRLFWPLIPKLGEQRAAWAAYNATFDDPRWRVYHEQRGGFVKDQACYLARLQDD